MSREIKFRAWNPMKEEFWDGNGQPIAVGDNKVVDGGDWQGWYYNQECDYITEQYTGLKDKNGKDIYEGDIVKNIEGVNETAVCVWDESNAEFDFRCKDGRCTRDNVKSWLEMYEVVGNIHENKELLDGSN